MIVQIGSETLEIDTTDLEEFVGYVTQLLPIFKTEDVPLRSFLDMTIEYARIRRYDIALEFTAIAMEKFNGTLCI